MSYTTPGHSLQMQAASVRGTLGVDRVHVISDSSGPHPAPDLNRLCGTRHRDEAAECSQDEVVADDDGAESCGGLHSGDCYPVGRTGRHPMDRDDQRRDGGHQQEESAALTHTDGNGAVEE